jgi:hypothetical protein
MLVQKKIYNTHYNNIFSNNILKKILVKHVYTKFLIYKTIILSKQKIFLLDNFLNNFIFKIRKKYKKIKKKNKFKVGSFIKCNLFIYKHSLLSFYFFKSVKLKTNFKYPIYFSLRSLKTLSTQNQFIYIFKIIRGGFLGFSNKICAFFSKNFLIQLKNNIIRFKHYFLVLTKCLPYSITQSKSFIFFNSGFTRKFRKLKKYKKNFFFKRFKFRFNCSSFYLTKKLLKFFTFKFLNYKLKYYFYNLFFKIFKFLL